MREREGLAREPAETRLKEADELRVKVAGAVDERDARQHRASARRGSTRCACARPRCATSARA